MRRIVVYDANVLYPAQLRDLLMRLAVAGLVRAHGSDQIHAEWMAHVCARHPDVRHEQLEHTRMLMEQALSSARVEGYERSPRSRSRTLTTGTWSPQRSRLKRRPWSRLTCETFPARYSKRTGSGLFIRMPSWSRCTRRIQTSSCR